MRTVYFLSCEDFPRSGAVSNYIQYFVCALAEAGYTVKLIARKSSASYAYFNDLVRNGKIEIIELPKKQKSDGKLAQIKNEWKYLKKLYQIINDQQAGKDSLLITYISLIWYLLPIIYLRKKKGYKLAACPVEHFPREHFCGKHGWINYKVYRLYYNHYLPRTDMCFAISSRIKESIDCQGGKAEVIPIMADTGEYAVKEKEFIGKYNIIFPANGMMKDALQEMLDAVAELDDTLSRRMEFHICGVRKSDVLKLLGEHAKDDMLNRIHIHDWMEYDELVLLYQSMHYMLLARPVNLMTESNFPSKVPEVMTHGVVPIASDVGDYTKYYLRNGENSIVFQGCNKECCKEALTCALQTPYVDYLQLSANARLCAESRFDFHNWSDKLRDIIEGRIFQ